jgi:hypothetical protein
MTSGSVTGTILGGLLLSVIHDRVLILSLIAFLIASAIKVARYSRPPESTDRTRRTAIGTGIDQDLCQSPSAQPIEDRTGPDVNGHRCSTRARVRHPLAAGEHPRQSAQGEADPRRAQRRS